MTTKTRKQSLPMLQVRAAVGSVDEEARTAQVTWSTGARVLRPRLFDEPFYEELDMSRGAIRLERFTSGRAPLLDSHRAHGGVSGVVGVVENARVANGQGTATVRFSEREDVDAIFADVQAGILSNVSVGYRVWRFRDITEPDDEHQVLRAIDWEPLELSIVAIGADTAAHFRAEHETNTVEIEERTMDEDTETTDETRTAETQTRAERDRVREIYKLCRKANLGDELADDFVERGVSLTEARSQIADKLVERQSPEIDRYVDVTDFGGNGRRDFMAAACDGLLIRSGVPIENPHPAAKDFRGSSILAIARDVIGQRSGTSGMSANELVQRALSVSDFADILANTMNKALLTGLNNESSARTFSRWTRAGLLQDFKTGKRAALSEFDTVEEVPEGAEYTYGSLTDSGEPIALTTYGKLLKITRQAIINDDLDALTRVPNGMGQAASRKIADLVYNVLTGNPTMRDSNNLFDDTNHGNVADAGSAITVTALSEGRQSMREQKAPQGEAWLNISPRFIICGPDRETEAEQVLADITPNSTSEAVPAGIRNLELVVDPRISDGSWYLAADPTAFDTVEVAYLDGVSEPFVQQQEGWVTDSVEFKVRIDAGVAPLDWRGLFKNAGA